ncbi:hypothetical protein [Synechococcus sp. UW179A]|uniref:hypothetical protein n=1 Tax=Synechococcus sp. UW179A TaxID=2575510 RepID=UPI000E0FB43E|nr:hypothetical protein [Synechococcus sp. UW179A]
MRLHNPLKLSSRLLLLAACFTIAQPATRVDADSTMAHCLLSDQNPSLPVESGPCRFSQRQGNVTIMFRRRTFDFPYREAGLRYQRSNSKAGIRFDMSEGSSIEVLWR